MRFNFFFLLLTQIRIYALFTIDQVEELELHI